MECAFTSPVMTECGLYVMCCMSLSAVWYKSNYSYELIQFDGFFTLGVFM